MPDLRSIRPLILLRLHKRQFFKSSALKVAIGWQMKKCFQKVPHK